MVDSFISEEYVSSHFEYEYLSNKIESQLTNFVVHDLKTINTDRARFYNLPFYRLSRIAAKNICDLTPNEFDKCRKDILFFGGYSCVTNAFDNLLKIKSDGRKFGYEIVENNLNFTHIIYQGLIHG